MKIKETVESTTTTASLDFLWDSSFLALKVAEWGLRPLVLHVDAGWNSELAVLNIEQICKGLGFDLVTHVVDWAEMRDLQLAFLRSGVANQDIP